MTEDSPQASESEMHMDYIEERQRIKAALEELLVFYRRGESVSSVHKRCPLHQAIAYINIMRDSEGCSSCPWVIFEGKNCKQAFSEMLPGKEYNKLDPQWVAMRLEQLPRWISEYDVLLNSDTLARYEANNHLVVGSYCNY